MVVGFGLVVVENSDTLYQNQSSKTHFHQVARLASEWSSFAYVRFVSPNISKIVFSSAVDSTGGSRKHAFYLVISFLFDRSGNLQNSFVVTGTQKCNCCWPPLWDK
jgi:hypothetical protein